MQVLLSRLLGEMTSNFMRTPKKITFDEHSRFKPPHIYFSSPPLEGLRGSMSCSCFKYHRPPRGVWVFGPLLLLVLVLGGVGGLKCYSYKTSPHDDNRGVTPTRSREDCDVNCQKEEMFYAIEDCDAIITNERLTHAGEPLLGCPDKCEPPPCCFVDPIHSGADGDRVQGRIAGLTSCKGDLEKCCYCSTREIPGHPEGVRCYRSTALKHGGYVRGGCTNSFAIEINRQHPTPTPFWSTCKGLKGRFNENDCSECTTDYCNSAQRHSTPGLLTAVITAMIAFSLQMSSGW